MLEKEVQFDSVAQAMAYAKSMSFWMVKTIAIYAY